MWSFSCCLCQTKRWESCRDWSDWSGTKYSKSSMDWKGYHELWIWGSATYSVSIFNCQYNFRKLWSKLLYSFFPLEYYIIFFIIILAHVICIQIFLQVSHFWHWLTVSSCTREGNDWVFGYHNRELLLQLET